MVSPQFQWTVVVFGLILGLSITRLLTSLAAVFRSRHTSPIDWVPLLWAMCIFILQLELWWSLADLRIIIKTWTFSLFLLFVYSPLLLFFASALVLPLHELREDETQRRLFELHGHWALIAISAYFLGSLLETLYFWKAPWQEAWFFLNVILTVLPLVAFFSARRTNSIIPAISLLLTIWFVSTDISIPIPS